MKGSRAQTRGCQFSFWHYLADHLPALLAIIIGLACVSCMLFLLGVGSDGAITIMGFLITCLVAAFIWGYMRQIRYWRQALQALDTVDRIAQYPDLVDEPSFLDGRLSQEIAHGLVIKGDSESTIARDELKASQKYTELWIHEIKTPLAASKLILENMHGADASKLKAELERAESLVEQAMYSARSSSFAQDYIIREVRLLEVIQEACKANKHLLVARGVMVSIEIEEDLMVLADKSWITFVISQLISNSAKYDSSEISFRTFDEVRSGSKGHCTLEVKDNGCGIPASDVPRVFDRAFTGSVGRAHGSATGMGLYLVATMCAKMGLSAELASEAGVGTRVMIVFPQDQERRRVAGNTKGASTTSTS